MRFHTTARLTTLLATALSSTAALAHPGHEQVPGALAGVLHSVTLWGPPLALLAIVVAGCLLWQVRDK